MSPVIDALEHSTAYLAFVLTLTGLIVGSFLNVVIHRLPIMMNREWHQQSEAILHPDREPETQPAYNLIRPRSACPSCGHQIRAWENIPVISYLFLRGRCSACKTAISPRYPAIEILSAIITVVIGLTYGPTLTTLAFCLLSWSLLALTLIDYDAAVALGRSDRQQFWPGGSPGTSPLGGGCRLFVALERVLAIQADHRQGRHGLW